MPTCKLHDYYEHIYGSCPKCRDEISERTDQQTGKKPLGHCPYHGYYYAKYQGIYDGCPVCARQEHG